MTNKNLKEKIMKSEPINRTSMWKFKLSAATMTLISGCRLESTMWPKALAEGLKLPVWLGSLGKPFWQVCLRAQLPVPSVVSSTMLFMD